MARYRHRGTVVDAYKNDTPVVVTVDDSRGTLRIGPGEWAVYHQDGRLQVLTQEEFEQEYEKLESL
jgi:phage gp45-like